MKLETFFEKFDQFADAPDAVAKMRELVLQLAVEGKLETQDERDEPAAKLLERIRAERLAAIKANKATPIQKLEPVETAGIAPGVRPGWTIARFRELAIDVQTGPFGSSLHKSDYRLGGTPVINPASIKNGKIEPLAEMAIGDKTLNRLKTFKLQVSDIVMARRGEMGRCAIVTDREAGWLCGTGSLIIRTPRIGEARYLAMLIGSPKTREYLRGASVGTTMQNLNQAILARMPVALPPLAEQKRIVAKVDELMELCDRMEAQQKERETRRGALTHAAIARFDDAPTPANLNFLFHPSYSVTPADLRKTILNLAVRGKLIPQDPRDETADTSLARLGLAPVAGSLDDIIQRDEQIPESWSRVRFEDIAVVTGGVTLGRKLGGRKTVTLPYLRVANVKRGEIDVDTMKEVTIAEDEIERYALHENDLLMTEGGDWDKVGRAAIWSGEISPCLHQNHIFRARMRSAEIKPFWFERYFNSPQGRSYFESASKQTTNLASINMRQVRGCPVPFPPLAEQHRILARVDQLMKFVDQLEQQIAVSETTAHDLLDAVVHDLLHPSAGVVEFPRNESDRASQRAAIGCYAIEYLERNPSFGRTMLMKACYLSETHLGLPLGWQPMRQAAGPWDPWIEDFESLGIRSDWFTVIQKALNSGHSKIEYSAKNGLKTKAAEAITVLGNQKAEFDRLLNLFADKSTEEAEIIATLFAAWNDFLIDGKAPTDDEIICEVRENWHHSKGRFSPALLKRWLNWMRRNHLVPRAHGPRTIQQFRLPLQCR